MKNVGHAKCGGLPGSTRRAWCAWTDSRWTLSGMMAVGMGWSGNRNAPASLRRFSLKSRMCLIGYATSCIPECTLTGCHFTRCPISFRLKIEDSGICCTSKKINNEW